MWFQLFIVLSCLISVSVNFSTFLVIGKTSPVTYQVLGHLKTCLVLAFGYVLLRDPFSWRNILGILIAVIGMVLYSYYCTAENQQKASEASAKLPEVIHNSFSSRYIYKGFHIYHYNSHSFLRHLMLSFFLVLGQGQWIWSFGWCGKWKWNFSWWCRSKSSCVEFKQGSSCINLKILWNSNSPWINIGRWNCFSDEDVAGKGVHISRGGCWGILRLLLILDQVEGNCPIT